jgi:hypothetical protein
MNRKNYSDSYPITVPTHPFLGVRRAENHLSISNNVGWVNAFLSVRRHSLRGAVSLRFG